MGGYFCIHRKEAVVITKSNNGGVYQLTNAGEKLFQVLINPDHIGKNVDQLCKIADVSRHSYYRLMKEDGFSSLVVETSRKMVMAKMGDILNATYIHAMDERGHQDRKMLLQMGGLHADKHETQVSGGLSIKEQSEILEKYLKS